MPAAFELLLEDGRVGLGRRVDDGDALGGYRVLGVERFDDAAHRHADLVLGVGGVGEAIGDRERRPGPLGRRGAEAREQPGDRGVGGPDTRDTGRDDE